MKAGLQNLHALFRDFPNSLVLTSDEYCLTGWCRSEEADQTFRTNLLYICTDRSELEKIPVSAELYILYIARDTAEIENFREHDLKDRNILFIASEDPHPVYEIIRDYFEEKQQLAFYGEALLDFLAADSGLQPAIDYSFQIFENPIFVFDANFNLIAATWEEIEKRGITDSIIENRGFTKEGFEMANRSRRLYEKVKKSELPIRAFNEYLGYEQMYCAINTNKDLGHIVVSSILRPFQSDDAKLLTVLKKYIDQQMRKDLFIRSNRGFRHEYFFKDLLEGKIASAQSFLAQTNQPSSGQFSENQLCVVVELERCPGAVNVPHIRFVLESTFPNTQTVIVENRIVAVVALSDSLTVAKEYITALKKICIEHDLCIGASNAFRNIFDLRSYYRQALTAIDYGDPDAKESSLFLYRDYYLKHVASVFSQKESPEVFCHPKMKILQEHDKHNRTELAYTMYMYLLYGQNVSATAEAMKMHRSSLIYRLKKINELIGDSFYDQQERLYMILSYEMCQ